MDSEHFQVWRKILQQKLQKQRGLLLNAKNEKDRWIYHGNVRYLEGQIDLVVKLIEGRSL